MEKKGWVFPVLENVFTPVYNSGETLTVTAFLIVLLSALVLGALHAVIYGFNNRSSKSFSVTLATLPGIVSAVILMVSGSIGAGVAVAGTFSLVRFRSAPGSAKEIAAVFTSMALGLACGMGYPALAFLLALILGLADTLYAHTAFGEPKGGDIHKTLQITVPESLEYNGVFDDIFQTYTTAARLVRVKTTNLGSLNRLSYELTLRNPGCEKAMIDELRCRNGNLEISLSEQATETNEL